MLSPVLLIGVGGSGGKTLRALRQTLLRRLRQTKDGWEGDLPEAWQMLWLDTITTQGSGGFPAPLLPNDQYVGLVQPGVTYETMIKSLEMNIPASHRMESLGGWSRRDAAIQIVNGAGQYRSIGRTVAVERLKAIHSAIDTSYKRMRSPQATAELRLAAERLGMADDGGVPEAIAFVISSVSGGTGAGMFLDVAETLKSVDANFGRRTHVVLYGPDVFSGLKAGETEGVAPNALGSISEVVSGVWTERMTLGSDAIYKGAGLNGGGDSGAGGHGFGGRYTYLIGSSNGRVQIGEQHDMYNAVGDALSAIVADSRVQNNFVEHIITNSFDASADGGNLNDKTRLRVIDNPHHRQPLASLGFGRATLGMERFVEYGAEAVGRASIERMLWPTFEKMDPNDPSQRERPLVDKAIADNWLEFLEASGLNERNPKNDVVDAIKPSDEDARLTSFAGKVINDAQAGMAAAGVSPDVWMQRIQTSYNSSIQAIVTDGNAERFKVVQTWTAEVQQKILNAASVSVSRRGLQVTLGLIKKLREEVSAVAGEELPGEVASALRRGDELPSILNRTLQVGMASIPTNHPTIDQVRVVLKKAAEFQFDAERFTLASSLLIDIELNVLAPLQKSVESAHVMLMTNVKESKTSDGRPNPFEGYPELSTGIIPKRLQPGVTEFLLIETAKYRDLLMELVKQSIPEKSALSWESALVERAIRQVPLDERGDKADSTLFKMERNWVPKERSARSTSSGEQPLHVSVTTSPEAIVDQVRKTIFDDHDIAIGKFVSQGLNAYLSPLDPSERQDRRDVFLKALEGAINVSEPFALYDIALMPIVHPGYVQTTSLVVSAIPFPSGTELYELSKSKLAALGKWDDIASPQWFGTTEAAQIDFFQVPTKALNPMVFTSLTKPIADSWSQKSKDEDSRAGFWNYRRARPLVESVPAAQEVQQLMSDGWFLALFLNQIKREVTHKELGRQISVWSPESKGYISFPYPLLSSSSKSHSSEDWPSVLESLSIALIQASQLTLPVALGGYWRLRDLGERMNDVMSEWVLSGALDANAPTPEPSTAGSVDGDWQSRRQALLTQVELTTAGYKELFAKVVERNDPFDVSKAFELKVMIERSLENLKSAVDHADGGPKGLM
jgi:hypothetical protein